MFVGCCVTKLFVFVCCFCCQIICVVLLVCLSVVTMGCMLYLKWLCVGYVVVWILHNSVQFPFRYCGCYNNNIGWINFKYCHSKKNSSFFKITRLYLHEASQLLRLRPNNQVTFLINYHPQHYPIVIYSK